MDTARRQLMKALGDAVRNLREAQGMDQLQLARKAGLDPTRILTLEGGKYTINIRDIVQVAKALDVPVEEITEHLTIPFNEVRFRLEMQDEH